MQMFPFLIIFYAVFVSLFLSVEYQDGTLRNKLIAGHPRWKVYASYLLTAILGCVMITLGWALSAAVGVIRFGWFVAPAGQLLLAAAVILLLTAAVAAVLTLIGVLVSNRAVSAVTAICGYLDLLEQEEHSAQAGRYLAVIRERTGAMRALTEELLQYTALSSRAEELQMEPVCLNDVLEQSLAGFYGALSTRGITPEIHMTGERVVRTLDAAALRRVFDNVLSNAVKYADGDLSVALTPEGTVTFSNAAPSQSHVQAERLFDRFFTVDTAGGSTGLGLSIARMLTEKMGGRAAAACQAGRLCISVDFPA